MANFKKDSFARRSFNKGPRRFDGPAQKYKANCNKCGDTCEVPFRPNGRKPVYCSNCFVKDTDSAPRPRREFSPRPQMAAPQAPRDDKALAELKSELQGINEKLERLLRAFELSRVVQDVTAPEAPAKAAIKKTAAKAPVKKRATKKA